jgi:hypothetical protein
MSSTNVNAWREIFARLFQDFTVKQEVTPSWLVNPETKRQLKLDYLYPDIGLGIRLAGRRGSKVRRRLSLEEEAQQRERDEARLRLCQEHGITLVTIDVMSDPPNKIFSKLITALSDVSRRLAKSDLPLARKGELIERNSQARSRLAEIARSVRAETDLATYEDLWRDRMYDLRQNVPSPGADEENLPNQFRKGMKVRHTAFGDGIISDIKPDGADRIITVEFTIGEQRMFSARLVQDKMFPRQ